jgi:uncharacterized membrane protein
MEKISKKEVLNRRDNALFRGVCYGFAAILNAVLFVHYMEKDLLAIILLFLFLWTVMGFLGNWMLHMIAIESLETYENDLAQENEEKQDNKEREGDHKNG